MGLGLDTLGADEKQDSVKDWFKKAGQKLIPAAASAASEALADKPKEGAPGSAKDTSAAVSKASSGESEGFLSKAIVGPVRVWHALVGVVAAGAGVVAYKKLHR